MRFFAALFIALAGALSAPSWAQDIPGRVGRVAFIEGSAAVYTDPEAGWERAYVNSPLTSENSIWTDPGARAEVRVGGTAVRLDQATQLDVARLDDDGFEAFVPRGTVAVRVRHYQRGRDLVFDTPHARFSLRADGRYRIDVDPDLEESRITVFTGEARVGSDSGPVRAKAGQTVRVFGGASSSYVVERAFNDPFDTWASQRDARWVETRSVQYVSPDMTGYEDLDSYGNWSQDPTYGAVWYPTRVASDWAPYRYGRWDYVRPWGWTWIDDSPWGYAPFHYGRWVSVNNRWAWYPGKRDVRPVWAPALVAWIGGSNFSVGVSSGSPSVGWYPLSPYDRYQPWYKASPTYINQVNIVVNNYQGRPQNAQARDYNRDRGATVVNRETVVDRRPVQQARVNVAPAALAAAAVVTAAAVLPAHNEVVQRRVAQRTQEPAKATGPAPRAGQATVAGPNNSPAARPEFTRRPAVANATPKPAEAAPAPAQRVSAPSATPVARPAREGQPATPVARPERTAQPPAREAQPAQPAAREAQPARESPQQQQAREAQQKQQERAAAQQQQQQAREAQQQQERAAAQQQQQAREQQSREAQQKQQQERAAAQQQQQAREQQSREAQQKQQQERAAAQQQQQQAREAQQAQQRQQQQQQQQERAAAQQQQQQAREQQSREAQQKQQQERAAAQQQQQQAREAQQKQQQERAAAQQQQQQAREAQQAQQRQPQQQPAERAQRSPAPPPPARTREEQAAKDKQDKKDKEDEEKKSRGR